MKMEEVSWLNADENAALDLAFTLMTYGAIVGLAWLFVVFGTAAFLLFAGSGLSIGAVVYLVLIILFGWMGISVAVGGAAFAVMEHISGSEA